MSASPRRKTLASSTWLGGRRRCRARRRGIRDAAALRWRSGRAGTPQPAVRLLPPASPTPAGCGRGMDGARAGTERAEVLGLLECRCRANRNRHVVRDRAGGAPAGVRGDRQPPTHRPLRVRSAKHTVHPARETTSVAPAATPARACVTCRRGWSRRRTSVATPSTTASAATCCTCQSRMRGSRLASALIATCAWGACATPAARARRCSNRRQPPTPPYRIRPPVSPTTCTPPASWTLGAAQRCLTLVTLARRALPRPAGQFAPIRLPTCMPLGLFVDQSTPSAT